MSKRIQELILNAGTTGTRQVWFTRPEMEKFASLMIQECLSVVQDVNQEPHGAISDKIRKYFELPNS